MRPGTIRINQERVALRQEEIASDNILVEAGYVGRQADFHQSLAKQRWIFGGNQGGKSFALCREICWFATGTHPIRDVEVPNTGWLVVLDKTLGINEVFPTIRAMLAGGGFDFREYLSKEDPRFEIKINGGKSIIRLKSVEQGFEKFQAARIRWIAFDEEPEKRVWDECQIRLMKFDGDQWCAMTPTHGMTWVYEDICKRWEVGMLPPDVAVFNWSTYDNSTLDQRVIDRLMAGIHKGKRQARLYGMFVQPEGLIWPEFDQSVHVVNPFEIPNHWPQYLVLDPGHAHYFGGLCIAGDPDGGCVIWAAHKERRQTIKTHLWQLADLYTKHGFEDRVNADLYQRYFRSGFAPEKKWGRLLHRVQPICDGAAAQYREEFSLYGIATRNAKKDVDLGLTRVSNWFETTNRRGQPMIRMFRGSTMKLQQEIEVYSWKDIESEGTNKDREIKGQEVRKTNDDLCDPLRYFVMDSNHEGGKFRMEQTAPPPGSFAHIMKQRQRAHEASQLMGNEGFDKQELFRMLDGGFDPVW